MNSRRGIDEVIADEAFSPALKKRLKYSKEVIAFAYASGLNTRNSYQYYVHVDGPAISYIVSAAEKDQLKSVTWWFPIVGSVPYLGFFDKQDRDLEAEGLRQSGFDVAVGQVGAFSSLGWFQDPIYKPMLNRSRSGLAHLLFHELTHRTYWSIGSVNFNENLAEYIAGQLTEEFLARYGSSKELDSYHKKRRDKVKYKTWLAALTNDLVEGYKKAQNQDQALIVKKVTFQDFLGKKYPDFESENYRKLNRGEWNHARVLSSSLYNPDTVRFRKAHACMRAKSVGEFLRGLKEAEESHDEAFAALDSLCSKEPHVE